MSSVLLFEIGSTVCGAAPSMNALIVGRVIAGIGGSGVYIGYVSRLHSLHPTDVNCQCSELFLSLHN